MAIDANKLLHNVFFTLNDPSTGMQQKLVDDCYTFLAGVPGSLSFSAGIRAGNHLRNVNDTEFHVALTILFDSVASHDAYQDWGRHNEFIAANSGNWKQVRVFDSIVR